MARSRGKPDTPSARDLQETGGIVRAGNEYMTAIACRVPRDLDAVRSRCLKEAEYAGVTFTYEWTVKDNNARNGQGVVSGVSIDGAMILARNFGNCITSCKLQDEGPSYWIFEASFIDMETGFNSTRLFRQSKGAMRGGYQSDRALDMDFQKGQSKAIRNVLLKCMPEWLVEECKEAARLSAEGKFKNMEKERRSMVDAFARLFGVNLRQLEDRLGRSVDKWDRKDLVRLGNLGRGLREGLTAVEDEFPSEQRHQARKQAEDMMGGRRPTADSDGVVDAPEPRAQPAHDPRDDQEEPERQPGDETEEDVFR